MCNLSDIVEERGIKKGIIEGENNLAKLITCIMREFGDESLDIIEQVTKDETIREQYYKKYAAYIKE